MRPPKLTLPTLFVGIVLALLPLGRAQAAPLNPDSFVSLGANPFTQNATYTINSSANPPTLSGPGLAAPIRGAVANGIAVFTFNSLSVGAGVTVKGTGTIPIVLLSQANATVGGTIDVSGSGRPRQAGFGSGGSIIGGAGGPGGFGGGDGGTDNNGGNGGNGGGAGGGHGAAKSQGDGGGGSFGGAGGSGGIGGRSGTYGDLTQTLEGGSGGGGGGSDGYLADGGGGGGGALEIGAKGALTITGGVYADGGNGDEVYFSGGGGSGGSLIAFGSTVTLSGTAILSATGGTSEYGGGGGGGRILIASEAPQAGDTATHVTVAGGYSPGGYNGGSGVLTLLSGTVAQNADATLGHRDSTGVGIPLSAANALGHALTYHLVGTSGGAAHGTVSLSGSTARYTPSPGNTFVGDDTFQFTATDGSAASIPATVTVHLTNTAPVAQPDSYSTGLNTPLTVAAPGVLGDDTDADGDGLKAVLVGGPSHAGSFTLNANGSFSYAPVAGYHGRDSFTYKANDGYADSSTVTVSLTVNAGTPTANAQSVSVLLNNPTAVTLTGSDPDVPALPLTYAVKTNPAHGTLSGTAPNLTYTPTAGYTGPDSFTFRVTNGINASAPATVTLTVSPIMLTALVFPFPTPVPAGTVVTARVFLNGVTPMDVVVGLARSDSSVVRLHRAVVIPAGSSSATFPITTYLSPATRTVTVTATLGTVTLTRSLTITGR